MWAKGKGGLTHRQERFVDCYLEHLDASRAYREAGYKARTKSAIWTGACEILRNPKVQAALAKKRAAIERRTEISQDQVRMELAKIAFFDPRRLFDEQGKFIDIPKLSAEVAAAISSIEITTNGDGERVTKVRWCSKIDALDKLCRHLGMYEYKVRLMGLEAELAALTDEEIEGELIELERGDYKRLTGGGRGAGSRPSDRSLAGGPPRRPGPRGGCRCTDSARGRGTGERGFNDRPMRADVDEGRRVDHRLPPATPHSGGFTVTDGP